MTQQRVCVTPTCANPAPPDALMCTACLDRLDVTQGQAVTSDQFDEFFANPMAGPKEVIPSEDVERFARGLREQYVALTRQGFSDKQALTICGHVIASIISNASGDTE